MKTKLRLLNFFFGNSLMLFIISLLPILIGALCISATGQEIFLYVGAGFTLLLHGFNMCHMSTGIGYDIFKNYKKYVCGGCRKYTINKLTKCIVRNTIYYGPSGCLERKEKTKTKLCPNCYENAEKSKTLIETKGY